MGMRGKTHLSGQDITVGWLKLKLVQFSMGETEMRFWILKSRMADFSRNFYEVVDTCNRDMTYERISDEPL